MLNIKIAKTATEIKSVIKIRKKVFIDEQGVSKKLEIDGLDNISTHVIIIYNNIPIGCARIRFIRNKARLERIGILKKFRGKGFGKEIMKYLIKYCRSRKVNEIYFHSQYHAKDFYKKLDFKERGKIFSEAGIKHIEMFMKIK